MSSRPAIGRPRILGARAAVFLGLVAAAIWSAAALDLWEDGPRLGSAGWETARQFFGRALTPALRSEAPPPTGGTSLVPVLLEAVRATLVFAVAALALSTAIGLVLGFLGSTAWWAGDLPGGRSILLRVLRRSILPGLYVVVRVLIAVLRSVHELIWAVILLSALGLSDLSAVLAIAIPYSGTIAKIFSELVDETPRNAAQAMRAAGASPPQVFTFGLLPRALPDMAAYLFYQLECAIRSAAILGFFGFPTLGYAIAASFENLYFGEVWTYLYALFALLVVVEWWSGAIRRRLVG